MSRISMVQVVTGALTKYKTAQDGVGECGHWDSQLDRHGYCRDIDCRRKRLVAALISGDAFKMACGTLVWNVL